MSSNLSIMMEEDNGYVKTMMPGKSLAVYKFKFDTLAELRNQKIVRNSNIAYILQKKAIGLDRIYVGKSIHGITDRPFSHDDLEDEWDICYVVTDEGFCSYWDGTVSEYMENALRRGLEVSNRYFMHTKATPRVKLNDQKKIICDKVLKDIKIILEILGLSFDFSEAKDMNKLVGYLDEYKNNPDGIPVYYKDTLKGSFICGMYLPKASNRRNFLLFKGSTLCPDDDWAFAAKEESRNDYPFYLWMVENGYVVDDVVTENMKMSISKAKSLASGSSVDSPFRYFVTLNGRTLADELFYRKREEGYERE